MPEKTPQEPEQPTKAGGEGSLPPGPPKTSPPRTPQPARLSRNPVRWSPSRGRHDEHAHRIAAQRKLPDRRVDPQVLVADQGPQADRDALPDLDHRLLPHRRVRGRRGLGLGRNRGQLRWPVRGSEVADQARFAKPRLAFRRDLDREEALVDDLAEPVHNARPVEVDAGGVLMLERVEGRALAPQVQGVPVDQGDRPDRHEREADERAEQQALAPQQRTDAPARLDDDVDAAVLPALVRPPPVAAGGDQPRLAQHAEVERQARLRRLDRAGGTGKAYI